VVAELLLLLVANFHRASHGTKFLTVEEVEKLYGSKRHWKHFELLIESVDNIRGIYLIAWLIGVYILFTVALFNSFGLHWSIFTV